MMTDIQIDSGVLATLFPRRMRLGRNPVYVNSEVGYSIYYDVGPVLVYRKTTTGGATWGSPVQINAADNAGGLGVHFDRWTPGDNGVKIHFTYIQANTNGWRYRSLDTSTDALSSEVAVGTIADGNEVLDITKTPSGRLYCSGRGSDTTGDCAVSTDGGATWDDTIASPMEGAPDSFILLPGTGDNPWGAYWDMDNVANEISLKIYDAVGDSWGETSIIAGVDEGDDDHVQFAAVQRHSDGHMILIAWNDYDAATADLLCWDIGGAGSIVPMTSVVENSAESFLAGLFINQQNGYIDAFYARGSAVLSSVGIKRRRSKDGGDSWSDEVDFSDDADDDLRYLATSRCLCASGGRIIAHWQNEDLADLMTNKANSLAVAARFRTYPVISEFRTSPIPSEFRTYPVEV